MGYKFILNPEFAPEHVLNSDDFITVGDLSKALITVQGIKCLITECIPKVGISQKINTLYYLWQGGNSFHIECQIALSNNFTDLLRINYFDCDIIKYKKNLVDNAFKAVLLLFNNE